MFLDYRTALGFLLDLDVGVHKYLFHRVHQAKQELLELKDPEV